MVILCLQCSTIIKTYDKHRKFCSEACDQQYRLTKRKQQITVSGQCPPEPRAARRYLLEQNGFICAICLNTKWQDVTLPLILDHIDGNANNWQLSNLRMICPNCDALLPTFKGRNRGHGRWQRRKRYQEGKSY